MEGDDVLRSDDGRPRLRRIEAGQVTPTGPGHTPPGSTDATTVAPGVTLQS